MVNKKGFTTLCIAQTKDLNLKHWHDIWWYKSSFFRGQLNIHQLSEPIAIHTHVLPFVRPQVPRSEDTHKWSAPTSGVLPIFTKKRGGSINFNGDAPKWMVYHGKTYQNGWLIFRGTPILGKHPYKIMRSWLPQVLYDPLSEDVLVRILMFVVPLIRFLKLLRHWVKQRCQ